MRSLSKGESLLVDVTRLATAAQAGIEKRDELRGVLTAYQAKAQAIGLAESLELGELYAAARDVLYSAPCDLELAEQRRHPISSGRFVSARGHRDRLRPHGLRRARRSGRLLQRLRPRARRRVLAGRRRGQRCRAMAKPLANRAPVGVGPCERPGCDGIVEADGYCNVCGLAPVGGSRRVVADPSPPRPLFLRR